MPYKDISEQRAYARKHYLENKTKYLVSNKRRRQQLKDYVRTLKEKTACADCKINYPHYVMDFDHLSEKVGLINKFVANNNRSGLQNELKKCEIVCSNCHRKRSYTRMKIMS